MSIMPSHRQGLYLLEHCRIMVKDEKLCYVRKEDALEKYWSLPYGNTNVLLLGSGTSLTQAAARLLASENVMVGFVGGGGTPLFLTTQSEYRPTEYMQGWIRHWPDPNWRLKVAKQLQLARCQFIRKSWAKLEGLDAGSVEPLLNDYRQRIPGATTVEELMGNEAAFAKQLYRHLAQTLDILWKARAPGTGSDLANQYLDHGNYLAYGLAATALWVLGISHSLPVSHGMTRRGALVFDLADTIKDGAILPNAFLAAKLRERDQAMRNRCVVFLDQSNALEFMFEQIKHALEVAA